MAAISAILRREITERAHGLCEYCQTAQLVVITLEIDHILPQAVGGKTEFDNLCLVCRGCNSFKQAFQVGFDPDTGQMTSLFNPRTQVWAHHFQWDEAGISLLGLSAVGRATIHRLQINRESVLAARQLWVEAGWHPPKAGYFPLL
ncbi:MAG: HNH endonuclease [Armatimonadetes bacterium]|nr:HNH endonuclease [Anaerolineae bacterium]